MIIEEISELSMNYSVLNIQSFESIFKRLKNKKIINRKS